MCCSALVAVCFAAFIGQPSPSIANHERESSLTPRFAAAPKLQLAVHLTASRPTAAQPVAAAASRAPNRLSRVTAEEAQLRHIEADLVRVSGLSSSGKSAVIASASSPAASSAAASASSSEHLLSQSQLDAEVKKFSKNKEVLAKGLSDALQTMDKLRQEEADLHKELGQVLGKITTMKIITSMNIAVPDGMGGDQMQVTITRPVGGKATAKVVKGEGSAAAESSASTHEAFLLKQQPPFASHETALGNDGLGGSQAPLAQEAVLQPLAGSKVAHGMVAKVNGEDGLGGRIHPAASAVSNAAPKKGAFRLRDNRMDGIGGSGKHLFRRRSNKHSTKAVGMKKVRRNDGVGGDVRYREARNLKKVPRNRIHAWARDCGDGVGGKALWCDRVFSAAAGAKGSSSSASAVRATIKAALTAHDTAAKERAGFVSHHRRAGAGGGSGSGSGSGSGIAGDDGLGDDDDEDEDGSFGGGFSDFEGGSGGDGNFAGGYNSDGSDGSFSDDTSMDNSEGDSGQPEAQGAAADNGGGPAPAASGTSAKAATTQGGSNTRRRASRLHSAKHNQKGGSQEEQGSSGDSGSVADFQDQQGSSSDSGSVADFQDQPQAQDTTSQDQPSTGSDQSDSSASA